MGLGWEVGAAGGGFVLARGMAVSDSSSHLLPMGREGEGCGFPFAFGGGSALSLRGGGAFPPLVLQVTRLCLFPTPVIQPPPSPPPPGQVCWLL